MRYPLVSQAEQYQAKSFFCLRRSVVAYIGFCLLPLLVWASDMMSFSEEMLDFFLAADEELLQALDDESTVWTGNDLFEAPGNKVSTEKFEGEAK